ncbi:hypothetical protein ACIBSW_07045 [Actinoplanes sp. NPDC049668]|uniref:hypothetical protein n=1 Tax=unclassified Actinoplanes TaxID=2626549 RepID=UPI00339F759F
MVMVGGFGDIATAMPSGCSRSGISKQPKVVERHPQAWKTKGAAPEPTERFKSIMTRNRRKAPGSRSDRSRKRWNIQEICLALGAATTFLGSITMLIKEVIPG